MINSFFFNYNLSFRDLLFLALPISIIVGNFILNLNIILIILFFCYEIFNNKILVSESLKIFLGLIILLIFFNILFSGNKEISIKGWLGFIKNMVFFFYFYLLLQEENFKQKILKFYIYVLLFVIFDTIIQYILGYDIFGFPANNSHGLRLSGPFGDEYVVGAYISKMLFISTLILLNKSRLALIYMLLLFSLITIFLTQERSAFFITLMSFFLFAFFNKGQILKKLIFTTISVLLILLFLKYDDNIYKKYFNLTFQQMGISKTLHFQSKNRIEDSFIIHSFWDSRYGAHFLTAYEIFLDNKIIGAGAKTFRIECSKEKYNEINSNYKHRRCNTHPHNIYLEIFSETGLLGMLIFSCIIGYALFFSVKKYFINRNDLYLNNICILFVLFFPLQTTGSFFSTFNGIFYWIGLAFVFNNLKMNFFKFSLQKK